MKAIDLRGIRIAAAAPGSLVLLADCFLTGCGWRMTFTSQRLELIAETCAQHPCKAADPRRCTSCDHLMVDHQSEGCRYTVTVGTLDENLVCPCVVRG